MKLLVCISNVPDTTAKITFTDDNTSFNTSAVQFILNPYDEIALAKAIELTEGGKGTVTVLNVGDATTEPTLRKALAIGANDAIRINSLPLDGSFVSRQIAGYAEKNGFDLILTGRESIDYNSAEVADMLGELLSLPSVAMVKKMDIDGAKTIIERQTEVGAEIIEVSLPCVISATEGLAEPKIPNMRGIMSARTKPLQVIEPVEAAVPTQVVRYIPPTPRGNVKILTTDETAKLVELLHSEAKVI